MRHEENETPHAPNVGTTMQKRTLKDYAASPSDLASELGVTIRTVQYWCENGRVDAIKVGGRWRIHEDWRDEVLSMGN